MKDKFSLVCSPPVKHFFNAAHFIKVEETLGDTKYSITWHSFKDISLMKDN